VNNLHFLEWSGVGLRRQTSCGE